MPGRMRAPQRHLGRGCLIDRLAEQVGDRDFAIKILKRRGHLEADGTTLTAAGRERDAMTAEERALDRAVKETGAPKSKFRYNPKTNRATRR